MRTSTTRDRTARTRSWRASGRSAGTRAISVDRAEAALMVELLVNVDVDDLEKAIDFYRAALGLTLKRRLFDDTVAELAGASSPIFLLKKDAGSAGAATLASR